MPLQEAVSVFYMDIHFPEPISQRCSFSLSTCFWHLSWRWVGWRCVNLFLGLLFSFLGQCIYISAHTMLLQLLQLQCCGGFWNQVIMLLLALFFCLGLLWQFRVFCALSCIEGFLFGSLKNVIGIMVETALNSFGCYHFKNVDSTNPWAPGVFLHFSFINFFFWCLVILIVEDILIAGQGEEA